MPSLQQAQAAMDRMFDQAIADRPASDSSRLVAETFRPRLQALDSCAPAEAGDAVDCIATASAGINSRPQLLRLALVAGVWTLPDQRDVPVPAPPKDRVQALLRERIAAQAQQQADPALRTRYAQAAGTLQVPEPGQAAGHFFCLLKGVRHMRVLVGLDPPPDARERDAHVADVVALFARAYAPGAAARTP